MKSITYLHILSIVLLAGIYLTGCNSPSKKAENENVQVDHKDTNKSGTEFHVKKVATAEEWNVFKEDQELKMKDIELRMAEFGKTNTMPDTGLIIDSTFQERIVELEQKNNILRAMIKSYESNQTDWETFKRDFDHDMEELGEAFTDFTNDNMN